MASDLKWTMGFGWTPVYIGGTALLNAYFLEGALRYLCLLACFLCVLYMAFQYRKWNTPGWRQIHFRSMLLYASIAGKERGRADRSGEPFDKISACRELGLFICGKEKSANVEGMISCLLDEQGHYLANLMRQYGAEVVQEKHKHLLPKFISALEQIEFSPQLIIANIVENSFGGAEATKYVYALLTKEAH